MGAAAARGEPTVEGERRALVTGGAGFIGSHVVDRFLEQGWEVAVVDDLSSGRRELVAPQAAFHELDITDGVALADLVCSFKPAVICHLAAQASVTFSVRFPARDQAVNVGGTLNVVEAARRVGAKVVFASTGGALYGERAPLPTPEQVPPEPLSPYGASKLAGEAYLSTWARLYGQPHTILRLANVYGPRQNPHGEAGVVAIFSELLARGGQPTIFGDGTQTRDYTYVADVARAFLLAAGERRFAVYNVGTGVQTSVLELADLLGQAAGKIAQPRFAPPRPGELSRSALAAQALREALGWTAETPLLQGLRETYNHYARFIAERGGGT